MIFVSLTLKLLQVFRNLEIHFYRHANTLYDPRKTGSKIERERMVLQQKKKRKTKSKEKSKLICGFCGSFNQFVLLFVKVFAARHGLNA